MCDLVRSGDQSDVRGTIRILHVIDSLAAGGKERQLLELLKGLRAGTDVECELAILSKEVHFDELCNLGMNVHFLPRWMRYDPSILLRLLAIMRRFRPHIVHSWNSMCSIYGAPVAKLLGAKFVNGFVRAAPPNLTIRDADYFRGRLTMPLSDIVVANSMAGLRAYAIPAKKSRCIYNGFDLGRTVNLTPPEKVRQALAIETKNIVGMVGSFTRYKDYDTFFRAAFDIVALRDDTTFVAIGDGPNLPRFGSLLTALGNSRIRLLGRRRDVEDIVNTFTVGVLMSSLGEANSNALMEYMALGKPVIATDCAGNRELIGGGSSGYLISGNDAAVLTRHVINLLDDPVLAARLGDSGRRRISEHFNLEHMTESYVRLYGELLR